MKITTRDFGTIPAHVPDGVSGQYAGRKITNYVLSNEKGLSVEVSEYGAVIVKILVADRNGKIDDINLGYDDLMGYMTNNEVFGAPVGRSANRISEHCFTLNGVKYELENNDCGANLHSGLKNNYFKRPYDMVEQTQTDKEVGVTFHLFSPDGDQGYPGNLDLYITYKVSDAGEFSINYRAKSDKDTVFNMTNHSYLNLAGNESGTCLDQVCWVNSHLVTENKKGNLPTGRIRDVSGSPLDFSKPKTFRDGMDAGDEMIVNAKGYDFNYILNNDGRMILAATLSDPGSGRKMSVYTDLPGIQIYTGNYLDRKGKNGHVYKDWDGVAFESQFYPDSVHFSEFPSCIIKEGKEFSTTTKFVFTIE